MQGPKVPFFVVLDITFLGPCEVSFLRSLKGTLRDPVSLTRGQLLSTALPLGAHPALLGHALCGAQLARGNAPNPGLSDWLRC